MEADGEKRGVGGDDEPEADSGRLRPPVLRESGSHRDGGPFLRGAIAGRRGRARVGAPLEREPLPPEPPGRPEGGRPDAHRRRLLPAETGVAGEPYAVEQHARGHESGPRGRDGAYEEGLRRQLGLWATAGAVKDVGESAPEEQRADDQRRELLPAEDRRAGRTDDLDDDRRADDPDSGDGGAQAGDELARGPEALRSCIDPPVQPASHASKLAAAVSRTVEGNDVLLMSERLMRRCRLAGAGAVEEPARPHGASPNGGLEFLPRPRPRGGSQAVERALVHSASGLGPGAMRGGPSANRPRRPRALPVARASAAGSGLRFLPRRHPEHGFMLESLERKRGALLAVARRWEAFSVGAPSMRELLQRGSLDPFQSSRGLPHTVRYRCDWVALGRLPALENSADPGE